jgi:transcriptional regulator with XRE-family HTH domain
MTGKEAVSMDAFGEKLRPLRQKLGMTQAALAKASGIPLGTIRDLPTGQARSAAVHRAEAHALMVSLDAFPAGQVEAKDAAAKRGMRRKEKS